MLPRVYVLSYVLEVVKDRSMIEDPDLMGVKDKQMAQNLRDERRRLQKVRQQFHDDTQSQSDFPIDYGRMSAVARGEREGLARRG